MYNMSSNSILPLFLPEFFIHSNNAMRVPRWVLIAMVAMVVSQLDATFAFVPSTAKEKVSIGGRRPSSFATKHKIVVAVFQQTLLPAKTSVEEAASKAEEIEQFVNDGAMAWMQPFLGTFGMTEGKSLNYALPLEAKATTTDEQAALLRKEAASNLTNIGMDERERRGQAAKVFAVLTTVYAVWAAIIVDDGGLAGHVVRFGIVLPLFFTFGYKLSEETGL